MTVERLYNTLQQRKRPEDVAQMIADALTGRLSRPERKTLSKAAKGSLRQTFHGYSSMLQAFAPVKGAGRQVRKAIELFDLRHPGQIDDARPEDIELFITRVSLLLNKPVGKNDFVADRLNKEEREAAGLDWSKRAYNKRWRLLRRLEGKLLKVSRELRKREFQMIANHGLAHHIRWEDFSANLNAACFIAYYNSRCNLRSTFTNSSQVRAFDEVCAMLFDRCMRWDGSEADGNAGWWAIAHIYPDQQVLTQLTDERKGALLGRWTAILQDIAGLLGEVWERSNINRETMIVRRGNDSSTWNNTAGAWNKARDSWMNLVYALGMEYLLDKVCFGKVLRLMAADVVAWHRNTGGKLDPNTEVWKKLPLPWEVFEGQAVCTRGLVEQVCRQVGLNSEKSGWVAPRQQHVATFTPTPELVHGVAVGNPFLAKVLKRHKYFSGKPGVTPILPEDN